LETGIIVIGSGLAGVVSACAAAKAGLEVLLIDRGSICLGTNSALSGGVFTAPTKQYSIDDYIEDTLNIGRQINQRLMVEIIAKDASRALGFLSLLGVTLTEMKDGYGFRPSDLHAVPGTILMKTIHRRLNEIKQIKKITGLYITEIIKRDNRVQGVRGFDRAGREIEIHAPAVVLATGGGGAIYRFHDNQRNTMGQGYYLAGKAGLSLWDMEFVQFYPVVITEPHLPMMIVFPPFDKHIKLIDRAGRDILEAYDLGDMNQAILKKRDEFSVMLFKEMEKGPVYMDCKDVESSKWERFPLNLLKHIRPGVSVGPLKISPAAHFFMGGVRTYENMGTSIEGLFACGEVVYGLHGANRRGGNALTECATEGMIAGESAAKYATKVSSKIEFIVVNHVCNKEIRQRAMKDLKEIRGLIRNLAWDSCGIFRNSKNLKSGLEALESIEKRLIYLVPSDTQEMMIREDLFSALFTLKAILKTSSGRKESRGSFKSTEFPHEDNIRWFKNSCLTYDHEKREFSLRFHDVLG